MRANVVRHLLALIVLLWHFDVLAVQGAQTFTLDGRLKQAGSANPILDANVLLTIQVLDPSLKCILYTETQTVNTASSNGYFNIQVGSDLGSPKRLAGFDPGLPMATIFSNGAPMIAIDAPSETCPSGTYTPATKDTRYFRISVRPSSTGVTDVLADVTLDAVPTAVVAESAETVGGFGPAQLLRVNTTAPNVLSQANLQTIFSTPNFTTLQGLLAGSSTLYARQNSNSTINIPSATTPAGVTAGQVWYDAGVIKYFDGSTTRTISTGSSTAVAAAAGSAASPSISFSGDPDTGWYSPTADNLAAATGGVERVRIDSSGRLGIGTGAPTEKLSIVSSGSAANIATTAYDNAQYTNQIAMNKARGTSGAPLMVANGDQLGTLLFTGWDGSAFLPTASIGARVDGAPGANDMPTALIFANTPAGSAGAVERMRIAADGKVGIGTTTPGEKLDVTDSIDGGNVGIKVENSFTSAGSLDETAFLRFNLGPSLAAAGITVGKEADFTSLANRSSFMSFTTRNAGTTAEKMRITSSGSVGIGTTNPTATLMLKSGSAAAGTAPLKLGSGPVMTTPEAGAIEYDGTSLFYTDSTNTRRTLGVAGSGITALTGDVTASGTGSVASAIATGAVTFGKMQTIPTQTLMGRSTAATGIVESITLGTGLQMASGVLNVNPNMSLTTGRFANGTAALPSITFENDLNTGVYTPSNDSNIVAITTNGTEKMRIDGSGNIGFGTTTLSNTKYNFVSTDYTKPAAIFEDSCLGCSVGPLIYNNTTVNGSSSKIAFGTNLSGSPYEMANISGVLLNGGVNSALSFNTMVGGNLTEKMRINDAGYVGIGTTAPTSPLSIGYDSSTVPAINVGTGANVPTYISMGGGRVMIGYDSAAPSDNASNTGMVAINGGGTKGIEFLVNGTHGSFLSGTKAMTINLLGQVGIGTTSPTALLQLKAGSATAGTAPLKLSAGPVNTSPEAGAIEYDGTSLFYTDSTNTRRTLGVAGSGITALTGEVTATGVGSVAATITSGAVTTAKVADDAITFAKMQNIATNKLLGRSSASAGDIEELTIGAGLTLSGGTITNSVTDTDTFAALPCGNGYVPYRTGGSWTCIQATDANANSTLVARDATGNFAGNIGTLNTLKIDNGAMAQVTITTPVAFSSYSLRLPADDGAANQVLQTDGSGVLSWADMIVNGSTGLFANGSAAAPSVSFTNDPNTGIFSPSNNSNVLAFSTDGSEKMRIDTDGNIVVGSTTADAYLDITAPGSNTKANGIKIYRNSGATTEAWSSGINVTNGNYGTGTNSTMYGIYNDTSKSNGRIMNMFGYASHATAVSPATVDSRYGFLAAEASGSGNFDRQYGFFVEELTRGTLDNYAIFTAGSTKSHLGGKLSVGGTYSTAALLNVSANATIQAPNANSNFHMTGSDGASNALTMDAFGNNFYESPYITLRKARGTAAAPTNVAQHDILANIQATGYESGFQNAGGISFDANENWAPGARGSRMIVQVNPNGSTAAASRLYVSGSGVGVGTSVPALRMLDVAGTMRLQASSLPGSPVLGDIAVDTADSKFKFYNGSTWEVLGSASGSFTSVTSIANSGGDITLAPASTTGSVLVASGTASTASGSGALVVTGGVGVSGNINAGGSIAGQDLSVSQSIQMGNDSANRLLGFGGWDDTISGDNPSHYLRFRTNSVERMRIDSSGSVGIGTTAPASIFNISGSSAATQVFIDTYAASGSASAVVGRFARGTSGAPTAAQVGDRLAFFGGRGYGTSGFSSSSSAGLAVISAENQSSTGQGASVAFETTPIGSTASARTERMRIAGDGNVGIGTTAPARLLHVNGPMRIQPATLPAGAAGDIAIDSGDGNKLKYYDGSVWVSITAGGGSSLDSLSDAATPTSNMFLGSGGGNNLTSGYDNIGFGATLSSLTSGNQNISIGNNATYGLTTQSQNVAIGFSAMYGVTGSGNTGVGHNALNNNSVGMGANNSGLGNAALYGAQGNDNVAVGYNALIASTGNYKIAVGTDAGGGNSGDYNILIGQLAGVSMTSAASDNILIGRKTFFTNNTPSTGNQNVVIGNLAASDNITRAAANNVIVGHGAAEFITSSSNNVILGATAGNTLTTGGSNILIGNNIQAPSASTSNFLNIGNLIYGTMSSARVGVGTTAPAVELHVHDGAGSTADLKVTNNTTGVTSTDGITLRSSGSDASLKNYESGYFSFETNSSEAMRIDPTGRVGIGTTAPASLLDVSGTFSAFVVHAGFGTASEPAFNMGGSGLGMYATNSGADLSLASAATERLRITSAGDVGIGTTAPSQKFEVNGSVKAVSFISTSDSRLKKNVERSEGLALINKITGVKWNWKDTDIEDAGVIAQEIERFMPWAVVTDPSTGYKAVKYNALFAPLIEATHELDRRVSSLEEENASLKEQVRKLEQERSDFDARLRALESKK